jgi:ribosome-binding protein aMBF1 (putative translation factor)
MTPVEQRNRHPWTPPTQGQQRTRKTLPAELASQLADAHRRTGASYRRVAAAIGIDFSYWRRITLGQRCPSVEVAERIIRVLRLDLYDPGTASWLREEAVEKVVYPPR